MNAALAADASPSRPQANPWVIAVVVTLAAFMEVLDTTIVNVALPHIAGSMSASSSQSTWTITSYLVSNGIVLPISGFLTRVIGRKRYFLICIGMFALCSLLCGMSTSLPELIVFRLLQGLAGGGLQPTQQSIILDTFKPEQRAQAFGLTAIAMIVAPVLGPTVGGWITDNYSWRWIFLMNVPIGIATLIGVSMLVKDPPSSGRDAKPTTDFAGLALIVLAFGSFQIMLDQGENADWFESGFICTLAAIAATSFAAGIWWLLRTEQPVVNLRTLKDRNFGLGCIMIAAMSFVLYSSSVLIPQLAQTQLGYTATLAGLVLTPGAVALIVLIAGVGRVMPYVQTRWIIAFGFVFLGCSFLYSHRLTPNVDFETLVKMRVFQTVGLGFLFVPISSIAYLSLPKELNADATALFTMFRNVAGSVGISVATALVETRSQVHMAYLSVHLSPLSQAFGDILATATRTISAAGSAAGAASQGAMSLLFNRLVAQSQLLAYMDVFMFCAVFAIGFAPLALFFSPAKAGSSGVGH